MHSSELRHVIHLLLVSCSEAGYCTVKTVLACCMQHTFTISRSRSTIINKHQHLILQCDTLYASGDTLYASGGSSSTKRALKCFLDVKHALMSYNACTCQQVHKADP